MNHDEKIATETQHFIDVGFSLKGILSEEDRPGLRHAIHDFCAQHSIECPNLYVNNSSILTISAFRDTGATLFSTAILELPEIENRHLVAGFAHEQGHLQPDQHYIKFQDLFNHAGYASSKMRALFWQTLQLTASYGIIDGHIIGLGAIAGAFWLSAAYNLRAIKYFQREEEYSADAHAATLLKKPDDLIELLAIVEQKQIEFLQKISPHIS
ncbi:MAG: M48 family metalloprotease [Alphaproteobacteria bacterium]